MWKNFNLVSLLIFAGASLILILSWFRQGLIYGGGDVGLPTYDPGRVLEIAKYIWWEASAPGTSVPHGLTSVPTQMLLSILQLLGFSPVLLQASLFFLLLILMGFGMYLLLIKSFGISFRYFALIGGFTYMFNPYMMISVWHRFIHNTIFLAAALPFLVIFWIGWIKKGSLKFLLGFLLVNLIFVYLYGSLAFLVTVWILLFLITLGLGIFPWQGFRNLARISGLFLAGLICFILTHSWWLLPTFTVGPGLFSQQHSLEDNVINLISLSKLSILPYTLQLVNPFYVINQSDFGEAYTKLPISLAPWLFFALVLIGMLTIIRMKDKAFWAPIALTLILLTKGAAAPFEFIYSWLFANFFPLGVIRNPFEKIGILLTLVYAILLVVGLQFLYIKLKRIFDKIGAGILLISLFVLILVYAWPMFAGKIFGNIVNPAFVEVPQYTRDANQWIKMQGKEGRILHLPLSVTEDISYSWKWGYHGVESSALFFSNPSISRSFSLQPIDDALVSLSFLFPREDLLRAFNVRFIVLHKDILWQGKEIFNPLELEKLLNNLNLVEKKAQIGHLQIYQVKDEVYQEKLSVAKDTSLVLLGQDAKIWPWLAKLPQAEIISPVSEKIDPELLEQNRQMLVMAKEQLSISESSPSASLARLIQTKELLKQNGEITSEKIARLIISLNEALTNRQISKYQQLIEELFKKSIKQSRLFLYLDRQIVAKIFNEHLSVLEQAQSPFYSYLKEKLVENNLSPRFAKKAQARGLRQVFTFDVPRSGEYQLLMTDGVGKIEVQVDEGARIIDGKQQDGLIDLGNIELSEGTHEISYFAPPAVNLATVQESQDPVNIKVDTVGKDIFKVNFQAKVVSGMGFYIQLEQDGIPGFNEFASQGIQNDWVRYEFTTPPLRSTTRSAALKIVFEPGAVLLKDLNLERVLTSKLMLRATISNEESLEKGVVENFVKINPTLYKGQIKLAQPGFLIFRETFHPGWKLKLKEDGKEYSPSGHYISNLYGNAWFLEKKGQYDFEINFEPQAYVGRGMLLAGITLVTLSLLPLVKKIKEKKI